MAEQLERGRCYEHVITFALEARGVELTDGAAVYVVHGVPRLARPPFARYGHAWIEVELPCGHVRVIDTQWMHRGDVRIMEREDYYRVGQIEAGRCVRYTAERALHLAGLYRHYGPWHEDEGTADDPVL